MILFFTAAIVAGTPLLLAILGELLTEKSGSLNLGVEGMMLMGAIGGFAVAAMTNNPILALLMAIVSGAIGALIYAFLTVTLDANQVVSGLAVTIFGTGVSNYFGKFFVGQVVPENVKSFFEIKELFILGKIPFIGKIFFNQSTFVYLSYIIVILLGIYLYQTKFGLYLAAIGENPAACDAAGINVILYKYAHILAGGALCGLAGAFLSLVYVPAWQENVTSGRGWIAVALVIFSKWNPYKALLGAYVFGGLDIVGFRLQSLDLHISQYLIDMLPYVVTILILIISSVKEKRNIGPKSLGINYYRENR